MAPTDPVSYRRYRRRIIGWGSLGVAGLVIVGAPVFGLRIENDLERRVPAELAAAGFPGVRATFSGQDGVLRCEMPLSDPERAQRVARDVRGVHQIDLDRACRVNAAPNVGSAVEGEGDDQTASSGEVDETAATTPPETTIAVDVTSTVAPVPDFISIVDLIDSDPQFSVLAVLIDEAGLTETLSDPDLSVTMFAPTDDAFDGLDADLLGQLRADPVQLASLLNHHVVAAEIPSSSLQSGALVPLEGASLTVVVDGAVITVGKATVTAPDLESGNGIVHAVDAVLVFDGLTDSEVGNDEATVLATLAAGRLVLTGTAVSEAQRDALIGAATSSLAAASVDDELLIDPDAAIDAGSLDAMISLIDDMPANLVSGAVGFDDSVVFAIGVAVDDAAVTAFTAAGAAVDVAVEVTVRQPATEADAARLETQLNDFVAANPILFQPNSADLSPAALTVLDQVAGIAKQYDGVSIVIVGHTDSDGTPPVNQGLSEFRAAVVLDGLVGRGVPADDLSSSGRGDTEPILIDGVEDKAASRRVEFRASVTG